MKKDITGKKFERWTVIKDSGERRAGQVMWECVCTCGTVKLVYRGSLERALSKSCGCLNAEATRKRSYRHGLSHTPFHNIYMGILDRCRNPNTKIAHLYYGKGIKCHWKSFEEFKSDMYGSYKQHISRHPGRDTSIERIDGNGDYCLENCRWATSKEQARNTSQNHLVTFRGKTKCVVEWAEDISVPSTTLYSRLNKLKWPAEKALTTPKLR